MAMLMLRRSSLLRRADRVISRSLHVDYLGHPAPRMPFKVGSSIYTGVGTVPTSLTSAHATSASLVRRVVGAAATATIAASALGGAYMYYLIQSDEGFARSMYFYLNAVPAYVHYRAVQIYVEDIGKLGPDDADAWYNYLHDKYATPLYGTVLALRGFYIKLAQIASTRGDFLPKQYMDHCKTLQSDAPYEPSDVMMRIVESSYGKSFDKIFKSINPEPLGAASIGQVHKAELVDGTTVVVKVQFPDAEKNFRNDMKTIKRFAAVAQPAHLPFLNEVEKQFMTEFDYTMEADNLDMVRANIEASPYAAKFIVPHAYKDLCTKEVLVMEYLKGKKLIDGIYDHFGIVAQELGLTIEQLAEKQKLEDDERDAQGLARRKGPAESEMRMLQYAWRAKRAATTAYDYTLGWVLPRASASTPVKGELLNFPELLRLIVEVHGYEIFVNGCFNGDPHPGNILLLEDGRIGLIDYGQVKHLTKEQRKSLARLVVALAEGTEADVARSVVQDVGVKTAKMDPYVLEKMGRTMMDRDDRAITEGMNIQLFVEYLQKRDPITEQIDDFVMAYRVSLLLRGLSNALRYEVSHANMWKDLAKRALAEP
ncbi:Aste57867_2834 [Aphanomyces stellatus]|uniref:Aste57867_2834 protein n=1 Tax=Aphanomyces stellatus TaxID=120398 RepID=A0A485KAY0_9STRA|nr:hypothetical protein As57867_002826 [Aphanomyces stellatus]VFT80022.1 Aste57867_2834 [Aphanomyces stellatus]